MEVTSVATEKYYTKFVPTRSAQAIHRASASLFCCEDIVVHGKLGHGYFASVFLVHHRPTNRLMAMKLTNDASEQRREMSILSALNHENVLKLYGSCIIGARLVCLTKFANGGSLSSLLSAKMVDLPWSVRVHLALDIAQGLQHLHSHGLIHRDLSSANILIHLKLQPNLDESQEKLNRNTPSSHPLVSSTNHSLSLNCELVLSDKSARPIHTLGSAVGADPPVGFYRSPTSVTSSCSYSPGISSYPTSCGSSEPDVTLAAPTCHHHHSPGTGGINDHRATGDELHWPLPLPVEQDGHVLACSLWHSVEQPEIDSTHELVRSNSPLVASQKVTNNDITATADWDGGPNVYQKHRLTRLPTIEPVWKQSTWLTVPSQTVPADIVSWIPQYTAVVGDLGLCLDTNRENFDAVTLVGNPYYIAPECLNRLSPYTFAADVFAYGILICELITRLVNDGARIPRTPEFGVDHEKLNVPLGCPGYLHQLALDCCQVDHTSRPTMAYVITYLTDSTRDRDVL